MPEFPFVSGGVIRGAGATAGASSLATTLTANASNNVKGTAVQLIAATEFDTSWVLIQLTNPGNAMSYLVDLMIGAATEQVIIPDMIFEGHATGEDFGPYLFPLFIPKGSRISARCQAATGGNTMMINVVLIAGTLLSGGNAPAWVSAYGAVATSLGTNVDPGAVADTDSAWTEITAATDRAHNWLVIALRAGDRAVTAATDWRVSIGIGAATEQVLIPDLHFSTGTTADVTFCPVICLPVFIPAGSRLTAKARSSVTTDGDRDIWIKLYGAG